MELDINNANSTGATDSLKKGNSENLNFKFPEGAPGIRHYGNNGQFHKYTTEKAGNLLLDIGEDLSQSGDVMFINDLSLPGGASTKWHKGHNNGMKVDIKMFGQKSFEIPKDVYDTRYSRRRTEDFLKLMIDKTEGSNSLKISTIYSYDKTLVKNINDYYIKQ